MKTRYVYILLLAVLIGACKKQDEWLDKKANKSDIVPTTIADFQLVMNNTDMMNGRFGTMASMSSDNFYITYASWLAAFSNSERNNYIWAKDIYEGETSSNWNSGYQRVSFCNIVLDGLDKIAITDQNRVQWNTLKGTALFFRGLSFFDLSQTFSKPYNQVTAGTDLGIVLRLTADVNPKSVRASVAQSYEQLIADLLEAERLLPIATRFKTEPSKVAVQGTLARVYLAMDNYVRANYYANLALQSYSTLIDYNTLNASATNTFPTFQADNKEVVFYATCGGYGSMSYSKLRVDENLYATYVTGDLRKSIFYINNGANGIAFKGNYTGKNDAIRFYGVATNEVYLIRAETAVRLNHVDDALTDLNTLLKNRWDKNVAYVPFATTDPDIALRKIIEERRKELPFLHRWEDLRRLNKDPRFAVTLTRNLNGTIYTLPPNDPRYVYPLPDDEIKLSGLTQNER